VIPKRKYLIREWANGVGDHHFTAAERMSFLGVAFWRSIDYPSWEEFSSARRFASFDEAAQYCANLSKAHAVATTSLISSREVEL
jgi:hypothetical protein